MPIYTYIDACRTLAKLLDEARENNEVVIKSQNGDLFVVKFVVQKILPQPNPYRSQKIFDRG